KREKLKEYCFGTLVESPLKERKLMDIDKEQEGMSIYEYIVDNVETCEPEMGELICKLRMADTSGQFLASTARYLSAVDREKFDRWLTPLIEGAIERDRDRRYIGSLLEGIWGEDYKERVDELRSSDDNFRRIYKRIYSEGEAM
ncbi:MAG: hypothetical protein K2J87_01990, partial [Muribaculaceae bacterium]|nr:hypothetical protein [Muribaculaceae bacterium]